jgi:hypothetical protein
MLHHAPKCTTGDFQNKKHRFVQKCAKVNGTGPPGSPIKKHIPSAPEASLQNQKM